MNTTEFIAYIRTEMKDKSYDDYVHVFNEYKDYLEKRVKENPKDVEGICQLAAVYHELRYQDSASTKLMEELLCGAEDQLSAEDKARVYTNLAFFYEDSYEQEKCMRCLEEAVKSKAGFPNAYDALGRLYVNDKFFDRGLKLLEKASRLSGDVKYQYNYGVAQYCRGNPSEARAVFEGLLSKGQGERRVLYAHGVCCFYTGDRAKALETAHKLSCEPEDDFIMEFEIADLYYLCGEYAKYCQLTDKVTYYPNAEWLGPYFYSLKALGKADAFEKKLAEAVAEKDERIAESRAEELDEDYTELDKRRYIQALQKEKEDIIQVHSKIKDGDYIPQVEITLWFMTGCYLIDCPRHQHL